MIYLSILFLFLVVHALMDFPLQGDTVATNKNKHANTGLQKYVPWYYWLLAHSLSHGGAIFCAVVFLFPKYIIVGTILGIAETIAHYIIDYFKCEGSYDIHTDQLLHFYCKILWAIALFGVDSGIIKLIV